MESILQSLETNINYLIQHPSSEQCFQNLMKIGHLLHEKCMIKPCFDDNKVFCRFCHKYLSRGSMSSHKKSKKHIINEAKHFNQWSFQDNNFKST